MRNISKRLPHKNGSQQLFEVAAYSKIETRPLVFHLNATRCAAHPPVRAASIMRALPHEGSVVQLVRSPDGGRRHCRTSNTIRNKESGIGLNHCNRHMTTHCCKNNMKSMLMRSWLTRVDLAEGLREDHEAAVMVRHSASTELASPANGNEEDGRWM